MVKKWSLLVKNIRVNGLLPPAIYAHFGLPS